MPRRTAASSTILSTQIGKGGTPLVGGDDGVKALALADAALESFRTGRVIRI
jgi:hypothetical protein